MILRIYPLIFILRNIQNTFTIYYFGLSNTFYFRFYGSVHAFCTNNSYIKMAWQKNNNSVYFSHNHSKKKLLI